MYTVCTDPLFEFTKLLRAHRSVDFQATFTMYSHFLFVLWLFICLCRQKAYSSNVSIWLVCTMPCVWATAAVFKVHAKNAFYVLMLPVMIFFSQLHDLITNTPALTLHQEMQCLNLSLHYTISSSLSQAAAFTIPSAYLNTIAVLTKTIH